MMNYISWISYAKKKLVYSDSPKLEAIILLKHVTKQKFSYLIAFEENELTKKQETKLEKMLIRRNHGEPIFYLTKQKEFWSQTLKISSDVLIPRYETECLVENTLLLISNPKAKILDLGTGSGAISLALASELSHIQVTGIDISDKAIKLAKYNAKNLKIKNVNFLKSNWFSALSNKNKFDIIVSNPPYIDKNDPHLMKRDMKFEPKIALISSKNGLKDIQFIVQESKKYLNHKGWLLIEHGFLQGKQVKNFYLKQNYKKVKTFQDYNCNDRITIGQLN